MAESAYLTVLGSIGIGILLVAFILNLIKKLSESSMMYLGLNVAGCTICCTYAYLIDSIPFVVLEVIWGGAALIQMLRIAKKSRS